jgi:diguanylate cyclase (GGDEF)-like protein
MRGEEGGDAEFDFSLFDVAREGWVFTRTVRDGSGRPVDFRVLAMNPAARRFVNQVGDPVGRTYRDLYPEVVHNGLLDGYIALVEGGPPISDVVWYDDGRVRGHYRLDVRRFGDGFVMSFEGPDLGAGVDPSTAVLVDAMQGSATFSAYLLAVIGSGEDVDLVVEWVTPTVAEVIGQDPGEFVGRRYLDLVPFAVDSPFVITMLRSAASGMPSVYEGDSPHPNAPGRFVQVAAPISAERMLLAFRAVGADHPSPTRAIRGLRPWIAADVLFGVQAALIHADDPEAVRRVVVERVGPLLGVPARLEPAAEGLPPVQVREDRTVAVTASGHTLIAGPFEVVPHADHADLDALRAVAGTCAVAARRAAAVEALERQATTDPLTGLLNRAELLRRLASALARNRRLGTHLAVLLIDLDRFKQLNDNRGHAAGDELLRAVADRLRDAVRSHDLVARLGGDEFVIVAEDLDDSLPAAGLAERVAASLSEPFRLSDGVARSGGTVGVTVVEAGADAEPGELLQQADTAMYDAKPTATRVQLFDEQLAARVRSRQHLESRLREAVDGRRVDVHFQPILDLRTGDVAGAEALARLPGPDAPGPGRFIPVAAELGLLGDLADQVTGRVAAELARWRASAAQFVVQVNISSTELVDPGSLDRLLAACELHGLPPSAVTVEISEEALAEHDDGRALDAVRSLRAEGVGVAIDDFTTGHSSLLRLGQLDVDTVKLDRAFVADLDDGTKQARVIDALLRLADVLGLAVIAEGIETRAQLDTLRDLGCRWGQGFLLAPPAPAQALAPAATSAIHPR